MSGSRHAGSYADLLRLPAVARTFVPGLVGRLTYGVLPLSLLFTVQHATESFSIAATVMGLNAITSLSMPLKSRAIDRNGQRLIIPLLTAAMVIALLFAVVMAHLRIASAVPWLAAGAAVGLTSPPLGPSMRAQWRELVPEQALSTAYSLDAVAEEALYLLGPVIAAGILTIAPASAGLLLCAALVAVGAAGLAASPPVTARPAAPRQRPARGPLRHGRFLKLLLVMGMIGVVSATIYTGTAARALAAGHPSFAGLADAGVAAGSVAGGLLWGRLQPGWTMGRSLARLLALLGGSALVASAVGPFPLFAAFVSVAGLATSPIYVVAYQASDRLVHGDEVTEASTWVTTASNVGISLGGSAAGWLVAGWGARAPGWVGGVLALALACTVWAAGRSADGPSHRLQS